MLRRPPRSTLFPTRRSSDLSCSAPLLSRLARVIACRASPAGDRSEEHTSELQSHSDLVCRLLLEKKKNKRDHDPGTDIDLGPQPLAHNWPAPPRTRHPNAYP